MVLCIGKSLTDTVTSFFPNVTLKVMVVETWVADFICQRAKRSTALVI